MPWNPQLWSYCLARGMHRHVFRQDAVFHEMDHTVLRILVKFSWHVPDFPIYSNRTKPGTLQRKGQGTMLAYGQPNPDAVIVNRVFETA